MMTLFIYLKDKGLLFDLDSNEMAIKDLTIVMGDHEDVYEFVDMEDVDRFVDNLAHALSESVPIMVWDPDTNAVMKEKDGGKPYVMTLGGAGPSLPLDVELE